MLSDRDIRRALEAGDIEIDPFDPGALNPNSINLRLAPTLLCNLRPGGFDMARPQNLAEVEIPRSGYRLMPGRLYLGATYERVGSKRYVPSIDGRSSTGRLGLGVHVTAGRGDAGDFFASFTLEMWVVEPLVIYPMVPICQAYFEELSSPPERPYRGNYLDQGRRPAGSRLWRDAHNWSDHHHATTTEKPNEP
ncbi:MAG: dCTP deaminase [Sumerlaeia bacterium]